MKKIEMNVSMQRKLSKVLEYKGWKNFLKVLSKAKEACKNFGFKTNEQPVEINKLSKRKCKQWIMKIN